MILFKCSTMKIGQMFLGFILTLATEARDIHKNEDAPTQVEVVSMSTEDIWTGLHYLHLLNLTTLTKSDVLIGWRIEKAFYESQAECANTKNCDLRWAILKRKSNDDSTAMHLTGIGSTDDKEEKENGEHVAFYSNLAANVSYVFCLSSILNGKFYIAQDQCKTIHVEHTFNNTLDYSRNNQRKVHYDIHSESVTLSWNKKLFNAKKARSLFSPMSEDDQWKISYRQFTKGDRSEVILLKNKLNRFNYTLNNLQPSTGYIVCVHQTRHSKTETNKEIANNSSSMFANKNETTEPTILVSTSTTEVPENQISYVYTSTGQKVPIPNFTGKSLVPGNFAVVGPALSGSEYSLKKDKPSFPSTFSTNSHGFLKRRKRDSIDQLQETSNELKICHEFITNSDDQTLIMLLIIAVASSVLATLITFFCCCWARKCFANDGSIFGKDKEFKLFNQNDFNSTVEKKFVRDSNPSSCQNNSSTMSNDTLSFEGSVPMMSENDHLSSNKHYNNGSQSLLFERVLFDNKDEYSKQGNIIFHPGYDVPPSSTKRILGYDYPNASSKHGMSMAFNYNERHSYRNKNVSHIYDSPQKIFSNNDDDSVYDYPKYRYIGNSKLSKSAPTLSSTKDHERDHNNKTYDITEFGSVRVTYFPSIPRPVRKPKHGDTSKRSKTEQTKITITNGSAQRQSIGEVTLSGGTLIEVPDGYVVPGRPKPT